MDETWTISELAEHAAAALAADGVPRVNGRVRDLPNERLIRWYTSIGLLDPPVGRRGRTALYGPRHLLQLLAVKRRQALGRSIAEIQVELAGVPDSLLRRIAAPDTDGLAPAGTTPQEVSAPKAQTPTVQGKAEEDADGDGGRIGDVADDTVTDLQSSADTEAGGIAPGDGVEIDIAHPRDAFWTVRPATRFHREPEPGSPLADTTGTTDAPDVPALIQGVRLAPGVTVMLETRHLNEDDLAAIAESAAPLLDTLRRRGLLEPADRAGSPQRHSPGRPQ